MLVVLPALELVHGITEWMGAKMYQYSLEAQAHDKQWTPHALAEVKRRAEVGRKYAVTLNGDLQGMVTTGKPGGRYLCTVRRGRCQCGVFQDTGIPCAHATAVIRKAYSVHGGGPGIEDFIEEIYKTEKWRAAYGSPMPLVSPDFLLPHAQPCVPPRKDGSSGRPTTVRAPSRGEQGTQSTPSAPPKKRKTHACGNCGRPGHNKATCKNDPLSLDEEGVTMEEVESFAAI